MSSMLSRNAIQLDAIQPVVLVGGASARFGRNKLLEPIGAGGLLVDRPITALRDVFGMRVVLVGDCDPRVASRADGTLADRWPGAGPAGGIASALAHFGRDIFVLAGDLPAISQRTIRLALDCAAAHPTAAAVLACVRCPEPCVGIYRYPALAPLEASLRAGSATGVLRRLEGLEIATIPTSADEVANANTPEQLAAMEVRAGQRGHS